MYEALEIAALLTVYSVSIVHALAGVVAMLPSSSRDDVGPREGL